MAEHWYRLDHGGSVTTVSVVSANGFAGTVATATSTPAITIETTVTGILSGNGTSVSAASTTGSNNVVLSTSPSITTATMNTLTVPATDWIYFNTTSDNNWRMGYGTSFFTTSVVGSTTSLQIVTGAGSGGPDGFAIGSSGGVSSFEVNGHTNLCYFGGHITVEGVTSTGATGTR